MYRNILVPVDFTAKNRDAIETALDLARPGDGSVVLLHVVETLDLPVEEVEDFYRRLEGQARRKMGELVAEVAAGEVEIREHLSFGKRASEIVGYVEEHEVDIIVMTSHRLGPEHPEGGWMTISHQVAIFAPCAVLLLR